MKIKFEKKLILWAIIIAVIPLTFSYIILIKDKLSTEEEMIERVLKNTSYTIVNNELVREKIMSNENDGTIQEYTKDIIENINDIDIIVICDMEAIKYSHLYENQVGEKFRNPDKKEVLENGESYFSLMEGSAGKTFRWFEPIMNEEEQIGFIMIGKYYNDIVNVNLATRFNYAILFLLTLLMAVFLSGVFAKRTKKLILNMEPEEIATLYKEKEIILNNVANGIIALNKNNEITEANDKFKELFEGLSPEIVVEKLKDYIELRKPVSMKEVIIKKQNLFFTLRPIIKENIYLGTVIILSDKENIHKVAKEITGVDEVIKSLRVNVHEFKNNLHVILGLIQLEKYKEAKNYILKIQKIKEDDSIEFAKIKDSYVRSLLLSRKLVAKEKNINFNLLEDSILYESHNLIDSKDLVTILGNLIENAFEACITRDIKDKFVEVYLYEDDEKINIKVFDNGVFLKKESKENIFVEGYSSKGKDRGFGLYLVKSRVDLYNGSIKINEYKDKKVFKINIFKGE